MRDDFAPDPGPLCRKLQNQARAGALAQCDGDSHIRMLHTNLKAIPRLEPLRGYALRFYEPGDRDNWLSIQKASDGVNKIRRWWFLHEFGPEERGWLAQRQIYLLAPDGRAIGTGTAWLDGRFEHRLHGRVHWLAVIPEYQGRGLGKVLLSAVCRRLHELGHTSAYLATSTARVPAITLYLQFGFKPVIRTPKDQRAWTGLLPEARAKSLN